MDNIVIIHFGPVELYPPLQNFIQFLEQADPRQKVTILTTRGTYKQLQEFVIRHPAFEIKRLGRSGSGINKVARFMSYLLFYLGALWQLLIKRPGTVLYYETISSFPAYLYKRFIAPDAKIMIHYHEYSSPAEYRQGMWLTKYFHRLERWLYPKAAWVSHTNSQRMDLFLADISPVTVLHPQVVPNFPPRNWHRENIAPPALPLKFVYVGALSLHTMYTKEMARWISLQEGRATWDIYSFNITADASEYLGNSQLPGVTLHEGMDYTALPSVLCNYHVGVVLYKGHIPNYVFNAPNKLFEYLNAGLQVWVPREMTGAQEYVDGGKVQSIEFNHPGSIAFPGIRVSTNEIAQAIFFAEEVFVTMRKELLNNSKD